MSLSTAHPRPFFLRIPYKFPLQTISNPPAPTQSNLLTHAPWHLGIETSTRTSSSITTAQNITITVCCDFYPHSYPPTHSGTLMHESGILTNDSCTYWHIVLRLNLPWKCIQIPMNERWGIRLNQQQKQQHQYTHKRGEKEGRWMKQQLQGVKL